MSGHEDTLAADGYTGDQNEGITNRCLRYIYENIALDTHQHTIVKASYLEVYNEGVYDLIQLSNKQLPVKWDASRGFWVSGLKHTECPTYHKASQVCTS